MAASNTNVEPNSPLSPPHDAHPDDLKVGDNPFVEQSPDLESDSDFDDSPDPNEHNRGTNPVYALDTPHLFDLYMFSNHFLSPGYFQLSPSNKWNFERITKRHNIPKEDIEAEIHDLNQLVLWHLMLPKLLWIVPWLCLPIGVVVYAVEDGFAFSHPDATQQELDRHLRWSYHGLFLFVGGGIGGVLLSTQLWNHCWYRCIAAMAERINALNVDPLWTERYGVHFDVQCDIPVLAGRSYGRAYYKIVITIDPLNLMENEVKRARSEEPLAKSEDDDNRGTKTMDTMSPRTLERQNSSNCQVRRGSRKESVFNPSGFVSRSVVDNKSMRSKLRESRLSHHEEFDSGNGDSMSLRDD